MSDYSKVAVITAIITAIVVGPLTYCGVTSAQASESSTAMKAVNSIPPALLKSRKPLSPGLHTTRLKSNDVLVRWQYDGRIYDAVLLQQSMVPSRLKKEYWVVSFARWHGYKSVELSGGSLKPTQKALATGDYVSLPSGRLLRRIIYLDRNGRKVKQPK